MSVGHEFADSSCLLSLSGRICGKLLMRCRNHQCRHDTGTMDWIGRSGHALGNTDLKKWWSEGTKGTGIFFIGIYRYLIDILSLFYRYRYLIGIWSVLIRYFVGNISVYVFYWFFVGGLSVPYRFRYFVGISSAFYVKYWVRVLYTCCDVTQTWFKYLRGISNGFTEFITNRVLYPPIILL